VSKTEKKWNTLSGSEPRFFRVELIKIIFI
jgi:hypothetical protein